MNNFDDLLAANRDFAVDFALGGFDGVAHAGLAIVTCMDSRIDPLRMIGLTPGDAKIFRNPGARVTEAALEALVLGVHLLEVDRIMIVPHTRCAMASGEDADITAMVKEATGEDISDMRLGASTDQRSRLVEDVTLLREHPHVKGRALVGGFLYDVDTGALTQVL